MRQLQQLTYEALICMLYCRWLFGHKQKHIPRQSKARYTYETGWWGGRNAEVHILLLYLRRFCPCSKVHRKRALKQMAGRNSFSCSWWSGKIIFMHLAWSLQTSVDSWKVFLLFPYFSQLIGRCDAIKPMRFQFSAWMSFGIPERTIGGIILPERQE